MSNLPLRVSRLFKIVPMCVLTAVMYNYALANDPGSYTLLQPVYRCIQGSDRFETISPTERSSYTCEGLVYYLSGQSGTALYRLYYSGNSDHMDSEYTSEGSYASEGILGYGWASAGAGMVGVRRASNASNDHALLSSLESLSGYSTVEYFSFSGYPRYGSSELPTSRTAQLVTLTSGNLSIASNKLAGGALWSITWNGTQFVNQSDYGRLCQTALFCDGDYSRGNSAYDSSAAINPNPTEGGSVWTNGHQFGSPLVELYNSGTTQSSLCVPLEFYSADFGGSQEQPVIWDGVRMGKNVTLGYGGYSNVMRYQTRLTVPENITDSSAHTFAPALFVNGNFRTAYTVNAASNTYSSVSLPSYQTQSTYDPGAGGGVIMSDSSTGKSIGIYGATIANGGALSDITYYNFYNPLDSDNSSTGANCLTLFGVIYGTISSGSHTYNGYIVVGDSVSAVVSTMRNLYLDGIK